MLLVAACCLLPAGVFVNGVLIAAIRHGVQGSPLCHGVQGSLLDALAFGQFSLGVIPTCSSL